MLVFRETLTMSHFAGLFDVSYDNKASQFSVEFCLSFLSPGKYWMSFSAITNHKTQNEEKNNFLLF